MINLHRAVKSAHLNQPFGYNLAIAKLGTDGNPMRPYQIGTVSESDPIPAGFVRFYPLLGLAGHNGRDWMSYRGEPVYFDATDGDNLIIEATAYSEIDADGGKGVDVLFQDPATGAWYQRKFWHLFEQKVFDGQKIKSGDLIGLADSTGASSGDHLHDGFKPLNSGRIKDKKYPANGYTGAVDPATEPNINDYQETSFILDVLNLKQQLTLLQRVYRLLLQLKSIRDFLKGRPENNNTQP